MMDKDTVKAPHERAPWQRRVVRQNDGSSTRLAGSNPFWEMQQTIGNQGMQRLFHSGVIQAKVRDKPSDGNPSDETDCSGWESDLQSFSVLVAKEFLKMLGKSGVKVGVVKVIEPPPHWVTRVVVHTGAKGEEDIVLTVGLSKFGKFVMVGRGELFDCSFDYHCDASGRLVLVNRNCP